MIVEASAPIRISLFGGGTDTSTYSDKYNGACLNFAINIYQNIEVRDSLDYPSTYPIGANSHFYRVILDEFGLQLDKNIKVACKFDGIIEGGMGSSASATVALIGAINKLKGLGMSRAEIAEKAWDIEVNKLGLYGGRQDQYAATYGGINLFEFSKGKVVRTPLPAEFINWLLPSIVLLYTGENRKTPKTQEGFKKLAPKQVSELDTIKAILVEGIRAIGEKDLRKVGLLMDKSWEAKKKSNKGVSTAKMDKIYERARKLGALGGKCCGSGGGGFMFFIVEPDNRNKFIEKMGLQHWDFEMDHNGLSTRILP